MHSKNLRKKEKIYLWTFRTRSEYPHILQKWVDQQTPRASTQLGKYFNDLGGYENGLPDY